MNVSLTGKVAVVTGAASGIGLATVLQFLLSGAEGVIAVDIAPDAPEPLRKIMETGRLHYLCGDVAVESTAREFTRLATESFGRLDVLVNNAGVSVVKPLHEHTPEEWDRVMSVNVTSAYWAARRVIPVMIKQRSGVILFTGSISGVAGIPGQGAYGPSKGAIHQLTRQMAIEYGRPAAFASIRSAVAPWTRRSSIARRKTRGIPRSSGPCSRTIIPLAGLPRRRR